MRGLSLSMVLGIMSFFLITGCQKDDVSFEEDLLIGTWKSGTEYYKYKIDGTGGTWDTSDDVTEEEAQPFTWTLVKSDLTHIHIMQSGDKIPKYYTVTELSSTTLKYKDDFGNSYSFSKVN